MWRTALLVAALLAQTVRAQSVSNATSSSSGTCSAAATTLSTTCGGLCLDSEPCLTYNASATCSSCTVDTAGECQYACFTDAIETSTSGSEYFVMLVTFGSYESEEEIAARAINPNYDTELGQLPDNTSDFAWASNSMLTSIDTIELPADVSYFVVSGGTTFDYVFKSKVVKLEFAADLVATQTQLLDVRLLNINLKSIVGDLPTMLPSSTMSLNLGNTLLSSFPSHLGSITSLETLYLNSNYITSVVATDGIDKLLVLSMRSNEMTEFEGAFPMLTALDLSYNNLTSIPDVVFTYSNLQSLYMASNQLTTPTFTTAQADFLAALTDFDLIANDFETQVSCATADRRRVHYLTVCISDSAASGNSSSSSSGSATTTDTDDGSNSNTVIIVAIVVGGVVVLCVVAGFIYWRRHRNDGKKADETISTQPTIGISTRAHDSSILSIWTDPEMLNIQVKLEEIQDVRMIGGGAFGVVWLVRYRSSQLLASKRLRPEMASHDRTQYFISEIKLVSKLDHPNIVTFVGAAWSIESDLQALFEYMENGDLRTFLSAASMPRYWNKTKFDIAVNVVEALVYVHSFQPPLVHRDLKSRNVLISVDMVAKLTDFGVSRYQSDNNTMTMGVGTSRWLAPEVIEGTQDYGPAADIFSFGVVLAELDTHAVPYDDAVGPNGHRLQDVAILQMVASGRLRPTFSRSVPPTVLELAQLCMAQEPSDRPSAAEVAYVLRSIQREMFGS